MKLCKLLGSEIQQSTSESAAELTTSEKEAAATAEPTTEREAATGCITIKRPLVKKDSGE